MASANNDITATSSQSAMADDAGDQVVNGGSTRENFIEKILSAIKYFAEAGAKMAVSIPDFAETVKEIESVQHDIKVKVEKMGLPEESHMEIYKLQNQVKVCILKAKKFLHFCVSMANFSCNPDLEKLIDDELPGDVKSLVSFIVRFCKYFKTCSEKFKDFDEVKKNVQKDGDEFMDKYVEKAKSGKLQLKKAQKEHRDHSLSHSARLVNEFSILGLSGTVTAKEYIPAVVAGSLAAFFTTINIFSHFYEYRRVIRVEDYKQDIAEFETVVDIAQKTKKEIAKCVKESDAVNNFLLEVWTLAEIADEYFIKINEEFADGPAIQVDRVMHIDISNKLSSIRDSMGKIIETLGTRGEYIESALINAQPVSESTRATSASTQDVGEGQVPTQDTGAEHSSCPEQGSEDSRHRCVKLTPRQPTIDKAKKPTTKSY